MENWPQPHEGVKGVDRTLDDLLVLTEAAMHRRVAMLSIATELWRAALNGAHTGTGRALYERMANPEIGDLVVEVGGMRTPTKVDAQGDARVVTCFGILLNSRTEWACTDEEWLEHQKEGETEGYPAPDNSRVAAEAAYVQYGPSVDDVCRWVNCSLISLPTGPLRHTEDQQP